MKWVITYRNDWHYRNRDNYPACNSGEIETAEGETLKEAIRCIFHAEAQPSMISYYADDHKYDGYGSIEIISCFKVVRQIDLTFEKLPAVRVLIATQKAKNAWLQAAEEKKKKRDKRTKDLALLKSLKEKYDWRGDK